MITDSHGCSGMWVKKGKKKKKETNSATLLRSDGLAVMLKLAPAPPPAPPPQNFLSPFPSLLLLLYVFFLLLCWLRFCSVARSDALCLGHDEWRRGSDRHGSATRLLPQISRPPSLPSLGPGSFLLVLPRSLPRSLTHSLTQQQLP